MNETTWETKTLYIGRHRLSIMNQNPNDPNSTLGIVVNNNLEILCFNLQEDFFEKRFLGLTVRHLETLAEYRLDLKAVDSHGNELEHRTLNIPARETDDVKEACGLMIKKHIDD